MHRLKAAKSLFKNKDARITGYEHRELLLLLADRSYHSPEISEMDKDDPSNKDRIVNIYDYSWRSDEVCLYFNISFQFIFIFYFFIIDFF